jgi:hypothetical protein
MHNQQQAEYTKLSFNQTLASYKYLFILLIVCCHSVMEHLKCRI